MSADDSSRRDPRSKPIAIPSHPPPSRKAKARPRPGAPDAVRKRRRDR